MRTNELKQLSELGVATVYEAAGRNGLIDIPLIQLLPGSRVAGPARTVRCAQNDNLMVHAIIEQVEPGEVLVLTMPEPKPVALIGELLVTQIKQKKAAGILVDAAVRDVEDLRELGLPIWTHFIRAKGATKNQIGELNGVVSVGGTQIAPGDVIILDADGGVCIQKDRVGDILQAAEARFEKETIMRKKLEVGELSFDLHGLRDFVENKRMDHER